MKLCEVRGCLGAAVGLVTMQARGWRVAESRRVCSRHHREFNEMEENKDTEYAEARQALRAVLVQLDPWHTDAMVEHMEVPQLVAALRKHHRNTVARLQAETISIKKELLSARRQALAVQAPSWSSGDHMVIAATASLLEAVQLELEPWEREDHAVVGMMLRGAIDELRRLSRPHTLKAAGARDE